MKSIFDRLVLPRAITAAGIDEAILQSVEKVLRDNLSRHGYTKRAVAVRDLRDLPLAHLMDQRVRLPRLCITDCSDDDAMLPAVERRLEHMIEASGHPGARDVTADALRVTPSLDAKRLLAVRARSAKFIDLCIQGRLGSAWRMVPDVGLPGLSRSVALDVVATMLIYHSAFQLQLLTARSWWIDHLPFRQSHGPGPYNDTQVLGDAANIFDALAKISDHVSGDAKRYPRRDLVMDQKPLAEELQKSIGKTDDELLGPLRAFFADHDAELKLAAKEFEKLRKQMKGDSLHKVFLGVTDGQALVFAATRLIQLRDAAPSMVMADESEPLARPKSTWLIHRPGREDESVAKLLFVYRAILLRDEQASQLTDRRGQLINLAKAWEAAKSGGTLPGQDLIDRTRALFKKSEFQRDPLRTHAGTRFRQAQRFDILPEFLLQRAAKVGTPPLKEELLEMAKKRHAKEQSHRPSPAYRAPKRIP
jgi:hypothetical protein